jgi:membrane protein YqaA with SNARE-associated domain
MTGGLLVGGVLGVIAGYIIGRSHQAVRYWRDLGRKVRREARTFRRGPRW